MAEGEDRNLVASMLALSKEIQLLLQVIIINGCKLEGEADLLVRAMFGGEAA